MSEFMTLDENYSTTKMLVKEKPKFEKNPDDQFESMLFLPEGEGRKGEGGLRTKGYFKSLHVNKPLISIISVVFNGERFLEETVQSVINQTYDNVEYIIIDGGSADGTLDIIKKYEEVIDYWVSEKDEGIYDAMNKGVCLCSGGIIGIVNADDVLYQNTSEEVIKAFLTQDISFTCGTVHVCDESGKLIGESRSLSADELNARKHKEMPFPHPTVFVSLDAYKKIGLFDTEFRLGADYDFVLRLLEAKLKFGYLELPTGKFRTGGASGGFATFWETRKVLKKRNVPFVIVYMNILASLAKAAAHNVLPNSLYLALKKYRKSSKNTVYKT